ncbi:MULTISPECIES: hypothetical protein [Halococcus]|uniref:Uncharacterized protein n=1 Tax=Halococcus salifodinae DSM 8989 TaxID=1227456 RepID=M0MZ75_9EURY|nr:MULTISPECIES: hypothetical protein [Halococcus]EMA50911.1 hypothetical protein C450_14612 [Halococcus salifodinae DSM 8989]
MADRSDADDDDAWEPRGPWVLAIGTAVIGAVAVLVTGVRAVRKRLQQDEREIVTEVD